MSSALRFISVQGLLANDRGQLSSRSGGFCLVMLTSALATIRVPMQIGEVTIPTTRSI